MAVVSRAVAVALALAPALEPGSAGAAASAAGGAAASGAGGVVFSLLDNRLAAHHFHQGGVVVDFGSAAAAKYLRFGRGRPPVVLAQAVEGERAGAVRAPQLHLSLPTAAQPLDRPVITVRLRSRAAGRLQLRIDGKALAPIALRPGAQTVSAELPERQLAAGGALEVTLGLPRTGVHLHWLAIGAQPAATAPPPRFHPASGSLLLHQGHSLSYFVWVPEGARLRLQPDDGRCTAVLEVAPQRGQPLRVSAGRSSGDVDLASLAGQVVRLSLQPAGCAALRLARAEIVSTSARRPAVAPGGPPPRHVVFWIMDSLRADRISVFTRGARPEVPTFEALARNSAVFTQAYVQGNESKVSHAAIWSSAYPALHDMLADKAVLAESFTTIDEVARKAGLFTSGVTANGYVIARRGFGNDWNAYRNHIHDGGGLTAADLLRRGLASVEKRKEPWFLYLGTIDTHVSWRGKQPWLSRYDREPYDGKYRMIATGADIDRAAAGKLVIGERDRERIRALYDSNVSYQDQQLGRLLAQLRESGIADRTMIIVTADHGDELWEAGRVGHGGSLRDILVRVPLLIHYPPRFPAASVSEGVETIDIVPTIADVLGVPADPTWQGESLVGLASGTGRGYPRLAMASQYENLHTARLAHWKLTARGNAPPELFDLRADPHEKRDQSARQPMVVRWLADALWLLRTYNREWRKATWGNPANVTPAFARAHGE